jgi:hypothetical protein
MGLMSLVIYTDSSTVHPVDRCRSPWPRSRGRLVAAFGLPRLGSSDEDTKEGADSHSFRVPTYVRYSTL